ncbi:MAG TPA: Fic family protein [Solirubrobacterales bacterium]|nr:Fic family protein [Solirubrobacterales bacterium]
MSEIKTDKQPQNRFARQLGELSNEERGIAEGALVAAQATFADFADAKESHYYRAPDLTPEETWRAITAEVARVTAIAAIEARDGGALGTADFHAIHAAIFEPVFGPETLAQRQFEQEVSYGIVLGEFPDELLHERQRGISGRSLPRRLREISSDFRRAFEESDAIDERGESHRVVDAIRPAARGYARFLGAHPYWDGNGRTAFPILNFTLIRLGLLAIAVPESDKFHWCLGQGMRRDRQASFEPLARHLEDILRNSQASG